jgi:hypothetical protein
VTDPPFPDDRALGDFAYKVAEASLSLVPLAGGPLAVLLGTILAPPLEKRRIQFLNDLARKVESLAGNVAAFQPEALAENEQFLSAVVATAQIADRTHVAEKREALRNAALNAAVTVWPDETFLLFLRLVDELLPSEVRVLRFLRNPGQWWAAQGRTRTTALDTNGAALFTAAFPERSPYETRKIWVRLTDRDLADPPPTMGDSVSYDRVYAGFATSLGSRFLRFISDPPRR